MRVIIAGRLSRKVTDRDQTGFDSQEREAVRWAESEGHEVVGVVADFKTGKSHLWDRPNLRPWVTDPAKLGDYDAIVALKVDRLTRADDAGVDAMKAWAREHGKSLLISSAGARFPSEGTDGIIWDTMIRVAHAEWLAISERYRRMQRTLRENGSVVGRAPWGYAIRKQGAVKVFAPTDSCRNYAPLIFQMIVDGKSLREVAVFMDAQGIVTHHGNRWSEAHIALRIIRNPAYTGERVNGGNLQTEGVVSPTLWRAANDALSARDRKGRGCTKLEPPLLRPVCGNPACDATGVADGTPSPMYRVTVGTSRKAYYRCTGTGPQRRGCGAPMIPCAELDGMLTGYMITVEGMHTERHWTAGDSAQDAIERLISRAQAATVPADAMALWREVETLQAQPRQAPKWETVETQLPESVYFYSLDPDARRAYLADRYVIAAHKDENGHPEIDITER